MNDQRIKFPRVSDRKISEVFRRLVSEIASGQASTANARIIGHSDIRQIDLGNEPSGDWAVVLSHDAHLIDHLSFTIGGLSIVYYRGGNYQPQDKSAAYDEISFTWSNNTVPALEQRVGIVAFLDKELRPFLLPASPDGISPERAELLAVHESTLTRLEQLNEDLINQSSDFRARLESKFDEKVAQVQSDYEAKKSKLDEEVGEHHKRLASKESELEEKLKAVDNSDNTYARRQIRAGMLADVKARISEFGVSARTEYKRKPVLAGIFVLILVFTVLLGWTMLELQAASHRLDVATKSIRQPAKVEAAGVSAAVGPSIEEVDRTHLYLLWVRFALFSFGLAGTLLYYVRWQNRWAEQHAASEFQLQQFYLDVNRASWVIESCLEWRKETGSVIPKELLASITNGLFVNNQGELERVIHPADELASALLGTASKVKLRSGNSEVEFDKPGKIPNKAIKVGAEPQSNP